MMRSTYYELNDAALISFTGEDAASFLHGQLTSDVLGLGANRTQYSGYCSPKGRLIATFLLWRLEGEIVLQLPAELRETVQSRLSKYVMRARVKVGDASARFVVFGVAGDGAQQALGAGAPAEMHAVRSSNGVAVARLPVDRYAVLVSAEHAAGVRMSLARAAARSEVSGWHALDVEAGVAVITTASQEKYVPQMVNLDLVGGVSYTKGCYPGQEIVARTHYLGQQKQRMYRIAVQATEPLRVGDPLYSAAFGEQASGTILYLGAQTGHQREALAVIQRRSVEDATVHLHRPDGPRTEILTLPYSLPA